MASFLTSSVITRERSAIKSGPREKRGGMGRWRGRRRKGRRGAMGREGELERGKGKLWEWKEGRDRDSDSDRERRGGEERAREGCEIRLKPPTQS